jgi:hypothetical protein
MTLVLLEERLPLERKRWRAFVPMPLITLGCALLGVAAWLYRMISDEV